MDTLVLAVTLIAGVGILRAMSGTAAQGALLCTSYVLIQCVFYLMYESKKVFLLIHMIIILLSFLFISNRNIQNYNTFSETDEVTGFRWSKPWPESPIVLEYSVHWQESRRAWPAEVRLASHRCPPRFSILVDFKQSETLTHLDVFFLDTDNTWHIPVKESFFYKDVLTLYARPVIYGTNCSVIYSVWNKISSLPDGNVRKMHSDHNPQRLEGVLLAQLWNPKY